MKITNDNTAPGLKSEKNDSLGRSSKNVKLDAEKSAPVPLTPDELELSSKKMPATNPMRETQMTNAAAIEFDVSEIPMFKQRLQFINNFILSNPAEAMSAQANLNPDLVAGLIG